ncbi:thioredoxin family protein [Arthrobacter sp. UYCu723]
MATIDITEKTFAETLESNEIVFVDFWAGWAGWCGPCRLFAPTYSAAAGKHPEITFAKVDTEAEQALAAGANITSIPTLMAFKDKTLVFSQPGALNAAGLEQVIDAVKNLDVDALRAEAAQQQS